MPCSYLPTCKQVLIRIVYRNPPSTSHTVGSNTLQGSQISYDDKV